DLSATRSHTVTHYAYPLGYIFAGRCFPGSGRSHTTCRARPASFRQPARRRDRPRLSISRPAISKHLHLLRGAHLVAHERRGRHRYYGLNAAPLASVDSWLSEYRTFWKSSLTGLKAFVEAWTDRKLRAPHAAQMRGATERRDPRANRTTAGTTGECADDTQLRSCPTRRRYRRNRDCRFARPRLPGVDRPSASPPVVGRRRSQAGLSLYQV